MLNMVGKSLRNGLNSLRSRRKQGRGRGARTREKNGVLAASGNPIKLTVNATTNQKQARAFLHD